MSDQYSAILVLLLYMILLDLSISCQLRSILLLGEIVLFKVALNSFLLASSSSFFMQSIMKSIRSAGFQFIIRIIILDMIGLMVLFMYSNYLPISSLFCYQSALLTSPLFPEISFEEKGMLIAFSLQLVLRKDWAFFILYIYGCLYYYYLYLIVA